MTEGKRTEFTVDATCAGCGVPVGEGATPVPDGQGVLCRSCSYAGTVGDVSRTIADSEAVLLSMRSRSDGPGVVRKAIGLFAFLGVLAGVALIWTPIVVNGMAAERHYCVGDAGEDAPGLNECLGGLWRIRAALGAVRLKGDGELPGSLHDLEGIPEVCPGCGGTWIYEKDDDGGYRIACPTPEKHERRAVFLDHIHGPPRVLRIGVGDGK